MWSPLPKGWEMRGPAGGGAGALAVPEHVLEHRAVLMLPDGEPFSEVVETYTGEVLAFPPPRSAVADVLWRKSNAACDDRLSALTNGFGLRGSEESIALLISDDDGQGPGAVRRARHRPSGLGVGLHRLPALEKGEPLLADGHGPREGVGRAEDVAQPTRDRARVDRFSQSEISVIVGPIAGVAAYFRYQAFRRITRILGDRGPNHSAKLDVALVNVEQVKHVTRLAPSPAARTLLAARSKI